MIAKKALVFLASFLHVCSTGFGRKQTNTTLGNKFQCNKKIDSRNQHNGTISSPSVYPANISCRYEFIGVESERIQLRFLHFDLYYSGGDPMNPLNCSESDSVSVYIFINGKKEELKTSCGRKLPPMLMSSQHQMTVVFRSYHSSSTGNGFKAQYSFVTNFGITEGQQNKKGACVFNYQSSEKSEGYITSPNYNGLYPRNTECHYLFYGSGKERVHITFLDFAVDGVIPRCDKSTRSDYVSFSNFAETEDQKMILMCGLLCNETQEIWSDGPFFRVTFKSNDIYDSTGFQACYKFRDDNEDKQENNYHPPDNRDSETFELQFQNRNSGHNVHITGRKFGFSCLPMNSFALLMTVCCMFLIHSKFCI
ncbi:hypothetical protein BsWGS_28114 [Bradybaena similaris]